MNAFAWFKFVNVFVDGQRAAHGLEKQIMENRIRVDDFHGRVCPQKVSDPGSGIEPGAVFGIHHRFEAVRVGVYE